MRLLFLSIFFSFPYLLFSQNIENKEVRKISIKKISNKVTVDGNFDEPHWANADVANDFINKYPRNGGIAAFKTEVRCAYDDDFIYFAATCYATKPYIVTTLKREITLIENDGIVVVLDPIHARSSGYSFGCSAYGVQGDAAIIAGDTEQNRDWDGKWYSEVRQFEDRYQIEMAIPFKTLRFAKGTKEWGINLIRSNLKTGEFSTWSQVPIQFNGFDLGYLGNLVFDEAPPAPRNIALVPYINYSYSKTPNSVTNTFDVENKPNIGFDAKIALTSSLNLDLTTNPDFSQVDVDKQVTNLTRFNINLPEKRTFFLENSDIFAKFGVPPIRPFFSRTIGLDDEGFPQKILYGARLAGNITNSTRIGLMNIHTLGKNNEADENVSTVALQQNIKGRSYVKGLFINRQGFDGSKSIEGDFGRNAGVESAYVSNDGKWTFLGAYHTSMQPNIKKDNNFYTILVNYVGRNFSFFSDVIPVGENYYADRGFIARIKNYDAILDTTFRKGFIQSFTNVKYNIYPTKTRNWFQRQEVTLESFQVWNPDWSKNERSTGLKYTLTLKNLSSMSFGVANNNVNLGFATSAFTSDAPLPIGIYKFNNISATYASDRRKLFSYKIEGKTGDFYNGKLNSLLFTTIYRVRPWGNFELNYEYNDLKFPSPYGQKQLQLFGGKFEINFSRSLFWTTFVQVNTQNDRFNFNSRLQWRFKPLSDVFLVYTDNYAVQGWTPKYKALVLKVNYWLNL
jgi:hypothetical protein